VFVHIPQNGYVGVGTVNETVVPVKDFQVTVDGTEIPILQAPKKAKNMGEDADDPEHSEYLVRVEWEKVFPVKGADQWPLDSSMLLRWLLTARRPAAY
jgi:hypothetical protein